MSSLVSFYFLFLQYHALWVMWSWVGFKFKTMYINNNTIEMRAIEFLWVLVNFIHFIYLIHPH